MKIKIQKSFEKSIDKVDKPAFKHILVSSCERLNDSRPTVTKSILSRLTSAGYATFINSECDVKKISESIDNATCMIVCITQVYSVDEFCRFEAAQATKLNKPIIPVILKDRMILEQEKEWLLEMIIPNQPYVFFDEGMNEEGFERIFEKIRRVSPVLGVHGTVPMRNKVKPAETSHLKLKNEIEKLQIKKRKCSKIVVNQENSLV